MRWTTGNSFDGREIPSLKRALPRIQQGRLRKDKIGFGVHFFPAIVYGTLSRSYVKEFVHGDLGRTRPNVGSLLGCDADILQLDVRDLRWIA